MTTIIRALIWEQIWRNRVVFPVLALLLAIGGGASWAMQHAEAGSWALHSGGVVIFISFLCSLIFGIAPFTLTESHSGWRMSSMVTRWFVLPVPTGVLVLVSMVFAGGFLALLLAGWSPIFTRLSENHFDYHRFLVVWLVAAAALQTLAWAVPRRASQFWPVAGIIFVFAIIFSFAAQESAAWTNNRSDALTALWLTIAGLAGAAWYAASKNRCGDWPGELPVRNFAGFLFSARPRLRNPKSPIGALFSSESIGALLAFLSTLVVVVAVIVGFYLLDFWMHSNRYAHVSEARPLLLFGVLQSIPYVTVLWLAFAGLYMGGEPGNGFRTRLTSFRATAPVSAGVFAGHRISRIALCWAVIWCVLICLTHNYTPPFAQNPQEAARDMGAVIGRLAVMSAHLAIGALPLFLWGVVEGFPSMLLCTILTWFAPMFLTGIFNTGDEPASQIATAGVIGWVFVKVAVAIGALTAAWRAGHITWRYAVALVVGWSAVASFLIWGLPTWNKFGMSGVWGVLLLLPLARLALCPIAVAANRHR